MRETRFGKYRLVAELGQGGMADVILALAQGPVGFSKLVVIKRLRQHLAEDPEFVAMLMDEARLAARLNHPNIVHTNEVGEIDGRFFMAMEYLEGQPLTRLKRRAGRQPAELSFEGEVRVLADVLAGLHYAHELTDYDGTPLGVVHRDITPSNVFVTYEGVVKIVDFGIAKAGGRTTETKTGVVKGKMTYMPPEQALGQDVDRRADVFSVGVMLWEAATRQRMWKDLDDVVILGRLINGDVPISPREANPDVPEEIDAMCRRALCAEPEGRYETAMEFQNELEAWLSNREHQPTNRELGKLVSQLFESERREIKSIIETQLSKMKDDFASSLAPVIIPDSLPGTGTPSSTEISPGSTELLRPSSPMLKAAALVPPAADVPRRRRPVLGLAFVTVVAALGVFWFIERSEHPMGGASATPLDPAESSEPAPGPSSELEHPVARASVTLRAVPATARFSIDGGPWLDNPYLGEVTVDDASHVVRVEAEGYESKEVQVGFEKDVVLNITLEREKRPVRYYPPRPPPPPPPAVPQPVVHPKKPSREIFTGDPWKEEESSR